MINSKEIDNPINSDFAKKVLSPVSYDKGFHFFMPDGISTGETAISLLIFYKDLETVEPQSIRYHFDRGDFQKWIRTTIGDDLLAERIDKLEKYASDKNLRKLLMETVHKRLSELQSSK